MHRIKATAKAAEALRCPLVRVRHPYLHEQERRRMGNVVLPINSTQKVVAGQRWYPELKGANDGTLGIRHLSESDKR